MSRMLRVLVCGGRHFGNRDLVHRTLNSLMPPGSLPIWLIHGACKTGADRLADDWGTEMARHGVVTASYPARWQSEGRAAGPLRNARMLAEGRPDLVIAFEGGRGTADMVRKAKAAGVEVREVADA